ncbi:hypothetical protein [Aromatoleum diolicum]|uniref:Uncharacterized protein n=1 Tax=Aromatoleum diolicum TaxID=75796 RepID=A0ABX1QHF5_9RHOO|nr:hypothetical protein [Aromatoleum diolicum]NMG76970.1 hypothetical protein [Aromatoleum diolicum]
MKSILTVLAISLAAALPAYAEDAHHPDQPAAVSAPTPEKAVQKMQDNTTRMQSQLEAVAAAKSPEERQKLLMEHMQTMRENMMLGHQMATGQMGSMGSMGCQMMGDMGKMGGMGMMQGKGMMMAPDAASASPEAMANRMHQMERRMDMMQMMMERMPKPAGKSTGK